MPHSVMAARKALVLVSLGSNPSEAVRWPDARMGMALSAKQMFKRSIRFPVFLKVGSLTTEYSSWRYG